MNVVNEDASLQGLSTQLQQCDEVYSDEVIVASLQGNIETRRT